MATSYPYASGGSLSKAIIQFRKNFPQIVNANTLKKLTLAPNNESYVISVLRFLGLIDDDGKRNESAVHYFFQGEDIFREGLEASLRESYRALFDDFGDSVLTKSRDELVPWFRATDKSSEGVGSRQAATFIALAALAGYGQKPTMPSPASTAESNSGATPKERAKTVVKSAKRKIETPPSPPSELASRESVVDVGLTVRVEVNLPAGGDEATYDAIFKSIRKNLID